MLLKLNMAFFRLYQVVDHENRETCDSPAAKYFACTDLVMPTLRNLAV